MKTAATHDPCAAPRRALAEARAARIKGEEILASSEAHRRTLTDRLAAAEVRLRSASEQVADGALSPADDQLAASADDVAAVKAQLQALDRHALQACASRLAAARIAEEAAQVELGRWEAYVPARQAVAAAETALREEYPVLAQRLAALVASVEGARRAAAQANRQLPPGCDALPDPEATVRDVPAISRETVSAHEESRWVYAETLYPFPMQEAQKVRRSGGDNGYFTTEGFSPRSVNLKAKPFRITEYHPGRHSIQGPRLADLHVPALVAGEEHILAGSEPPAAVIGPRRLTVQVSPLFEGPEGMVWSGDTWRYR